jgi:hypothetical protein
MAHFAKINENNIVEQVIVLGEVTETEGQEYIQNILGLEGRWLQTSYNNNIRKQFAGIGFYYDEAKDIFISTNSYPSWTLDENSDWQPPIPKPDNDVNHIWRWDEEKLEWINIIIN